MIVSEMQWRVLLLGLPGRDLFLFLLQGKDEPMGRSRCPPIVKLNPSMGSTPQLLWFPVSKKGRSAGEVLVAAELLLNDKVKEKLRRINSWTFSALRPFRALSSRRMREICP